MEKIENTDLTNNWSPSEEAIEYLDNLINESNDISAFHKKANRKVLRVLFWIGENLKSRGVSETFIRKYLPNSASKIKFSTKPWQFAITKAEYLYNLYQQMVNPKNLEECMKEWEMVEKDDREIQ